MRKDTNTGSCNTGKWNTGKWNTGNWNTGHWNTGKWNTGDRNTGIFNTNTEKMTRSFDKEVSFEELDKWDRPNWIEFDLIQWVSSDEMTDEEKSANPEYKTAGGYLKTFGYKEAFQASYAKASREDQLRIKECPNFDAELFFEISGIRVDEEAEEMTLAQICKELGRDVKIKK